VSAQFDSQATATAAKPVQLTLALPLFPGTGLINVPIVAAHTQFTFSGAQGSFSLPKGQLNGAIKETDIQNIVEPAIAQALQNKTAADSGMVTAQDQQLLALFDTGGAAGATPPGCTTSCSSTCQNPNVGTRACACAVAGDGMIDTCEVSTNSIIKSIFAP